MPGTALDFGDISANKRDKIPTLIEFIFSLEEINK